MGIPDFDENGNLPPGIHECDWREFRERFGWNRQRRALARGLLEAVRALHKAGAKDVWIGGSFVSAKDVPNDWDGCYGIDGVRPSDLDAVFRDIADQMAGRPKQRARFNGEFILSSAAAGGGRTILDFFQLDRNGRPRGIVKLDMEQIP